jgi:hypothetical protein
MLELHRYNNPGIFRCPTTLVHRQICGRSGKIAGSGCTNVIEETFITGNEPVDTCDWHDLVAENRTDITRKGRKECLSTKEIMIVSPRHGDIYKIDPQVSMESQRIKFRIVAAEDIQTVFMRLDGKPLTTQDFPFEYLWSPSPGEHILEVMEDNDHSCNCLVKFAVN